MVVVYFVYYFRYENIKERSRGHVCTRRTRYTRGCVLTCLSKIH